jgi:cytochrome P450
VRDKAVLMVQSDPRTRGKGPEHLAAFNWMQDYAAKVIADAPRAPRNDLISQLQRWPRSTATGSTSARCC